MTNNYGNCGIGDGILKPDDVNERITNLEETNVKQKIWEEITAKGIDDTVEQFNGKTSVDTTIWDSSPYNSEAKEVDSGGAYTGEDIFTASGTHIKSIIDANGDYLLSGIPNPALYPRYSIVYVRKGTAKEFGEEGIPSSQILEVQETLPMIRDVENGEVRPRNDGDDLNMLSGGFMDDNVTAPVFLGSSVDTFLTTSKIDILGGTNETHLDDLSSKGTGILWGLKVTINAGDNTKFDISEGEHLIVDNYTDPENPTFVKKYYAGATAITSPLLTVTSVTFLGIDASNTIIQQAVPISFSDERDVNTLGAVSHPNKINIENVGVFGNMLQDQGFIASDIFGCIGPRFNCRGNKITFNGANLKIDKSSGTMTGLGINYGNSDKSKNIKTLEALTQAEFWLVKRTAGLSEYTKVSDVPTDKYDPNGDGTLVDIPDGEFATHRFKIAPAFGDETHGTIFFQYAQFTYDTLKVASDSFEAEDYIDAIELFAIHTRSILIAQKDTLDLSNLTEVKFVDLGRFGSDSFNKISNYSRFSDVSPIVSGMTDQRQSLSYVDSGGVLYVDIARESNFERDDISFTNSDSSINTVSGDFDNDSMIAGDKIIVSGTTNNNGIFTVVSITTLKIVVSETITDESAGTDVLIETPGKGDIKFNFEGRWYILDCTTGSGINGRARIAFSEGTDIAPQENWIYAIRSGDVAILQQATSEPMSGAYSVIMSAFVPSVATSIADGFYNSRRWTDTKSVDGRGAIATILSKIRDEKPIKSGLLANITINTVPSPDEGNITVSAGEIREIYIQNSIALDLNINEALVVNDFTTKYLKIDDLNDIVNDASNNTLINKFFQVIFIISLNADGHSDKLLINLPTNSYSNANDAFEDTNGYSVTTVPDGIKSAYLICAGVFRRGPTTLTNEALAFGVNNIDLRNRDLGASSSGAGTASVTEFSDANFAWFNNTDTTKRVEVDVSNITTGTIRKLIFADRDLDLGDPIFGKIISTTSDDDNLTLKNTADATGARCATTTFEFSDGDGARIDALRPSVGAYTDVYLRFFTGGDLSNYAMRIQADKDIDMAGALTLSGNLKLPNDSYIGITSDTNLLQLKSTQLVIGGNIRLEGQTIQSPNAVLLEKKDVDLTNIVPLGGFSHSVEGVSPPVNNSGGSFGIFQLNTAFNDAEGTQFAMKMTDVSAGSEDSELAIKVSVAGSLLQILNIDGGGLDITGNLTLTGTVDSVDIGTDVPLNTTHRTSDGKNHSDVVLNNTHRASTGIDHSYINQDVTTTATVVHDKLTLTSQCYFEAFVNDLTQTNKTGDGTTYTIIYDTETTDRNGDYNNSTGVFTAPQTGLYLLSGSIRVGGLTSSHVRMFLRLDTTQGAYFGDEENPYAIRQTQGTDYLTKSISKLVYLESGDTAQIDLVVSGGTKVVDIFGNANKVYSHFMGVLLC